jgi:hypothetical protein|tara:strand:- start:290 stop:1006 length:717 start_codon:yes stop_codon:yes gene_type:complete
MSQTITLNIPKNLSGISLKEYQKYISTVNNQKDREATEEEVGFANLKLLECFCGITMKEAYELPLTEFSGIIQHIAGVFKEKTPLQRTFEMTDQKGNTVKFGFIPKLDDISLGEFIDLDKYISDWQQMHKAMAVLYRPITFEKNDLYLIEDYEGTDKYSEVMLDSPVNVALGSTVFFYHLGKELSIHTMDYLEKQVKVDSDLQQTLEQNGDGINQFTDLLQETQQNLKKLQDSHYSNV